jgi:hypothetical protein
MADRLATAPPTFLIIVRMRVLTALGELVGLITSQADAQCVAGLSRKQTSTETESPRRLPANPHHEGNTS